MNDLISRQKFISLGVDCRVKYQITLARALAQNPSLSSHAFNAAIYASNRAKNDPGTYFFDWLVTPIAGLIDTIRDDFRNVFDREDLEVNPAGSVRNRRNGIVFQHNFTRTDGMVRPATIDAEYTLQRDKIDYLAAKTRRLMSSDEFVTYLRVGGSDDDLLALRRAIRARYPAHRFRLVAVRMVDDEGGRFTSIADDIVAYTMNSGIDKPQDAHWQGDDKRWGALLRAILSGHAVPELIASH